METIILPNKKSRNRFLVWTGNVVWKVSLVGEEYCLILIQKGMKAWEKKAEKSMEKSKPGERTTDDENLAKEKHFLVWVASTSKTTFGIL